MNFDELHKRKEELHRRKLILMNNSQETLSDMHGIINESLRVADVACNAKNIIGDLEKEFELKTGLTKSDVAFMFLTLGLLCAKWLIMGQIAPLDFDYKHDPNARDRIDSTKGDELVDEKQKEVEDKLKKKGFDNDKSDNGFRTISQILLNSVPYDAMVAEKDQSSSLTSLFTENELISRFYFSRKMQSLTMPNGDEYPLYGKNHHAYTLGHDPILGWIFGTIDIMTRSMTLKSPPLTTFQVKCDKGEGNKVSGYSNFGLQITEAFRSFSENNKRLPVAVAKQSLHFLSDKYCKTGLPIPLISAEKAQELIEKGWNSVEAAAAIKKVLAKTAKNIGIIGLQFIISFIINEIIKAIHLILYNEDTDGDIKLYQVRTRKILLTANCISSYSNIIFCTLLNDAKRLDIGGFIETIHRLISDTKFINDIKHEFIIGGFYKMIQGDKITY